MQGKDSAGGWERTHTLITQLVHQGTGEGEYTGKASHHRAQVSALGGSQPSEGFTRGKPQTNPKNLQQYSHRIESPHLKLF